MLSLTNTPRKTLEVCQNPPVIFVSPTSLEFGTVTVGNTNTLSFTIFNLGGASLNVTSLSLPFPTYTSNFSSGSIPAGGSQPVNITYTPTSSGAQNGNIVVNSNSFGGTNIVAVTAVGFKEIGTAFNGVSNYLRSQSNVPTPTHLSAFTYSFRFRTGSVIQLGRIQIQEVIPESHIITLSLGSVAGTGTIEFSKRTGGANQQTRIDANLLVPNTLYTLHCVSNGDANTMDFYINGILQPKLIVANNTLPNTSVSGRRLFGTRDGAIEFFNGTLYYARSYNKVLSLAEIQEEFNTNLVPSTASANQLYCWELQDAQNTTTRVASVGGVDLNLVGFTVGEQAVAQRDVNNNPI